MFPTIKGFKFDSSYIIVKQEFDEEETNYLLMNMLFSPNVNFKYDTIYSPILNKTLIKNIDSTITDREKYIADLMKKDSVINKMKRNEINFYIINKEENKTHGPMNEKEFDIIIKQRKINLQF